MTRQVVPQGSARDIVLGLGGTVDYEIVWDAEVLSRLTTAYRIRPEELDPTAQVLDERDLVRSVLGYLRDGNGGERYVASSSIIKIFAQRFTTRITVGGTCVRAALAMSRIGTASTVHLVSIDDNVRTRLPPGVGYLCSATEDSTDPHLIVQFPAGARIQLDGVEVVAPRPNRLIYVNDPPNRELRLSPDLGAALSEATVFLVSGFNSMTDASELDKRVGELLDHMKRLPSDALTIYEEAGFHAPELSRRVRERLCGHVDVLSMNEDEMQAILGRPLDLLDADEMAGALSDLTGLVPALTLVVHSGAWCLAVGSHAAAYRKALTAAAALAGTRYLLGDEYTGDDVNRIRSLPIRPAGRAFADELEALLPGEVVCVPVPVLDTATPTTIGLGDTFIGGLVAALAGQHPRRSRQ